MNQNLEFLYEKHSWLREVIKQKDDEISNLRKWNDDLMNGTFVNCVYCGYRYGPKESTPTSMADILKEHIEICPKHPMSIIKTKILENMIICAKEKFKASSWLNEDQNESNLNDHIRNIEKLFYEATKMLNIVPAGEGCIPPNTISMPCGQSSDHASATFCNHANESPYDCPCDTNCYCKQHSCKNK